MVMKKLICILLAFSMVFVIGGMALAEELEPEVIETKEYVRDEVKGGYCYGYRHYTQIPAEFTITFKANEGDCDEWPESSQVYLYFRDWCEDDGDCVCYEFYDDGCDGSNEVINLAIPNDHEITVESIVIDDTGAEILWGDWDGCGTWVHLSDTTFLPDGNTRPTLEYIVENDENLDLLIRDRWYNWNVGVCDDCEPGDVVLWEVCDPCCCDWEDAGLAGAGFFTMDLCNCNNIDSIELEILLDPCEGGLDAACCADEDCGVGCPCDPCDSDRWYGIWKYVEYEGCEPYCGFEPIPSELVTDPVTVPCGEDYEKCSIQFSFTGECGDDSCEPCTEGDLCVLEDDTFVAAYKEPVYWDVNLDNGAKVETKTWACDLCETASIELTVVDPCDPCAGPEPCDPCETEGLEAQAIPEVVSIDQALFVKFNAAEFPDEEVCRLEVCFYLPECDEDFGFFLENGDYWTEIDLTTTDLDDTFECVKCVLFKLEDLGPDASFRDFLGAIWAVGPKDNFPTEAPGDDDDDAAPGDDDDDSGTGGSDDDDDSGGGGGCNVGGFSAAILLLIAPIALLLRKRF